MKKGDAARDLFCCRCGEIYDGPVKLSFLALRLFSCPACGHQNRFPPGGWRFGCLGMIFWGTSVAMLQNAYSGQLFVPGLLGMAGLIAFQNAVSAVIRVRQARKFHQGRGRLPADWKGW